MPAYDDFAWFYHRYWTPEYHSAAYPILQRIWFPAIPPRGKVLDVCCGSGFLAQLLLADGYRVSGFDASPEMIRQARRHAPEAHFEVAEAASFRTRAKFDAAVSTFDSLNHILDPDELTAAFHAVARSLKPGASFAFDILLEAAYQTDWAENFSIVRDDHVLIISGSGFDFRTRLAYCRMTMFRQIDGEWRRSDTEVQERCYDSLEIDRALDQAGFGGIECYSANDLGMSGQLGAGRVFYVVRKQQG